MSAPPVRAFTPMLHVADVLRAAAFYALMGFEIESRHHVHAMATSRSGSRCSIPAVPS